MNKKPYWPKVLVFAPISQVKDYCMDEWINHISNLSYPNYEILLVDNSADNKYHQTLKQKYPHIKFKYVSPKGMRSQEFIAASQEVARLYILKGDYAYGMCIECDVFPVHDVIQRLKRHYAQVAVGIYSWHFGVKRRPLIQMAEVFNRHFKNRNIDYEEGLMFMDGKPKQVLGAGIGCALIYRDVFRKVGFRSIEDFDAHSDTYFYLDIYENNGKVIADTSVFCHHKNQSWGYQQEITNMSK